MTDRTGSVYSGLLLAGVEIELLIKDASCNGDVLYCEANGNEV